MEPFFVPLTERCVPDTSDENVKGGESAPCLQGCCPCERKGHHRLVYREL